MLFSSKALCVIEIRIHVDHHHCCSKPRWKYEAKNERVGPGEKPGQESCKDRRVWRVPKKGCVWDKSLCTNRIWQVQSCRASRKNARAKLWHRICVWPWNEKTVELQLGDWVYKDNRDPPFYWAASPETNAPSHSSVEQARYQRVNGRRLWKKCTSR